MMDQAKRIAVVRIAWKERPYYCNAVKRWCCIALQHHRLNGSMLRSSCRQPSNPWAPADLPLCSSISCAVLASPIAFLMPSLTRSPFVAALALPSLQPHLHIFATAFCQWCRALVVNEFQPFKRCGQIKEMDYVKGGLGWKVWGAAFVLSRRLLSLQKSFQDKHVLELGSGCGLCGLLAVKLGACEVVLTDYEPEILINLCNNVLFLPASILEPNQLGQKSTPKLGLTEMACNHMYDNTCRPAIVKVCILDWAADASSLLEEKEVNHLVWPKLSSDETFDWVIGSDLIYNHYNIKSLVSVVKRRLSKQGGQGLFAAPIQENQELSLFLSELDGHAMDAHVEQCLQQEWEACMEWLEVEEGGTLHGVDHYEGGLAIIYVTHRL
ncbi:hypothetical protein L7F22_062053 [Adiantum nelumboides]|nr:hypothetical protein [Adiantum nelumboides]